MSYSAPGIFNALDDWGSGSGLQAGDSLAIAQANTRSLRATIQAAINSCESGYAYGAIVLIPSNSDVPPPVNPPGTVGTGADWFFAATDEVDLAAIAIDCPYSLLFLGCGDATTLHMKRYASFDNNKHLFLINNASLTDSDANIGGITFQDLILKYDGGLTGGAAIFAQSSQNIRVFRCIISNVPNGITVLDTANFSLLECLSVGIADELRCIDTHFDGCQTAVQIIPGGATKDMTLENVVASGPGTQLLVQPPSTQQVENLALLNCAFTNTDSQSTDSAIVLDAGAGNTDIDTVRFVSCTCLLNPASGLEIRSARHVEILGGSYSGNTQGTGTGAGIWLHGSPTDVRIVGVGLRSDVYSSSAQQYAVIVGAGASNIFISDCDMTNYGSGGPLSVSSAGSNNIQVLKCPGYNDQGTAVSTSPPPDNAMFNGFYFTKKYYGPVTFYTTGSGIITISIQGIATPLKSGSFRLAAGSTADAQIHYSSAPTFLMIGE